MPAGVGAQQPGVGAQQPGVGAQQPGVGAQQPGVDAYWLAFTGGRAARCNAARVGFARRTRRDRAGGAPSHLRAWRDGENGTAEPRGCPARSTRHPQKRSYGRDRRGSPRVGTREPGMCDREPARAASTRRWDVGQQDHQTGHGHLTALPPRFALRPLGQQAGDEKPRRCAAPRCVPPWCAGWWCAGWWCAVPWCVPRWRAVPWCAARSGVPPRCVAP